MFGWLKKIIPSKNEREIKKLGPRVAAINALEEPYSKLSDEALARKTVEFRERLDRGEALDSLTHEAFATVREASKRQLGMRHYDVQLVGGLVLNRGCISEMKTGEGKTLVATLPMVLNALPGRGAHLVTVNDYLAKRDAEWMSRIYGFLGLSTGVIIPNLSDGERKSAYGSDITYGTNNEFGFDYLRDNMKIRADSYVHRYFPPGDDVKDDKLRQKLLNYAIVDEVDSVLIDEARTPLIISGEPEESSELYHRVNAIIPFLRIDEDFQVDEKAHTVTLTETGVDKIEHRLKVGNLYESDNILYLHHVNQALRAHYLYKREQHYVIQVGEKGFPEIVIVDEFTGRKMYGRRWSDGLHQAVEAKEGVKIQEENQTLATITFQNFFRMYKKLSGMTGTAETEAEEFAKIYDLDVVVIPTNRPIQRADSEDVIYKNEKEKFEAIVREIETSYQKGQPVLVGTTSVDKSEVISKFLTKKGIAHNVLNAKQHEREATIVAQAGRKQAVTVATNMAGRGTDIMLGGNPEMMSKEAGEGLEGEALEALEAQLKAQCAAEKLEVIAAGGLCIIGTERHESRRIDNQLRGRAGRQGDPGASRFFLSLDDDLLRIFGGDRIKKMMEWMKVPDDEPIEHPMVSKAVQNAQTRVEGNNFDIRKSLLDYDDVMNAQRRTVYDLRRKVLEGTLTPKLVREAIGDVVHAVADKHCSENAPTEDYAWEALAAELKETFNFEVPLSKEVANFEALFKQVDARCIAEYDAREKAIIEKIIAQWEMNQNAIRERMLAAEGAPPPESVPMPVVTDEVRKWGENEWRFAERKMYLETIDRLWKTHLVAMDHLRTGVHLNAYAQKDPKLIYKMEGFEMFQELLVRISMDTIRMLFRMDVQRSQQQIEKLKQAPKKAPKIIEGRGLNADEEKAVSAAAAKAAAQAAARAQASAQAKAQAQAQAKAQAKAHAKVQGRKPADPDDELPEELRDEDDESGSSVAPSGPTPVTTVRRDRPKIGRNDPCHCGSGKKYKNCHFDEDHGASGTSRA